MEIRDVIHGAIDILNSELKVIDSLYFQRLRFIKQLGFSEQAFPSASHNRYMHSIGTMHTASLAFRSIFSKNPVQGIPEETLCRWESVLRFAALLHDIGHGPLSHTTEFAMPKVGDLNLPIQIKDQNLQATHEDYTLKILLDSPLTPILAEAGREFDIEPHHIASLIEPKLKSEPAFFESSLGGEIVNFKPVLQQLISSEIDADRMDYLRRDSLYCGVSYGEFDFDWILSNLRLNISEQKAFLCLEHRALYAFEDFLISRFHMFLMVYFHHKSVVYDEMLRRYLNTPNCQYQIPSDINEFGEHHDAHLYAHFSESKNHWAKRIAKKEPYRMLVEFHSGIPTDSESQSLQNEGHQRLIDFLEQSEIDHLQVQSSGELSKYFRKPGLPIFVRYDNHFAKPTFIPLEKCTDLFQKYEKKRTIKRIYVSPEDFKKLNPLRRKAKLPFHDLYL